MGVNVVRAEWKVARWAEKGKEVDNRAGRAASTGSEKRHQSAGF